MRFLCRRPKETRSCRRSWSGSRRESTLAAKTERTLSPLQKLLQSSSCQLSPTVEHTEMLYTFLIVYLFCITQYVCIPVFSYLIMLLLFSLLLYERGWMWIHVQLWEGVCGSMFKHTMHVLCIFVLCGQCLCSLSILQLLTEWLQ